MLGNANCQHAHCIHSLLHVLPFQVDSPAQVANVLVSATNNTEEIESADVSLIVGLLSNVTNSSEDLQQEDVSGHSDCHCLYILVFPFSIPLYLLQVQRDILSTVSNIQQVSPEELAISQERIRTSARFVLVSL